VVRAAYQMHQTSCSAQNEHNNKNKFKRNNNTGKNATQNNKTQFRIPLAFDPFIFS